MARSYKKGCRPLLYINGARDKIVFLYKKSIDKSGVGRSNEVESREHLFEMCSLLLHTSLALMFIPNLITPKTSHFTESEIILLSTHDIESISNKTSRFTDVFVLFYVPIFCNDQFQKTLVSSI
jgi:hypothetical protein